MRRHSDTLRGADATTKEEVNGEKTHERASCEVRVLSSPSNPNFFTFHYNL